METLHVQMDVPVSQPAIQAAVEGLAALDTEILGEALARGARYVPLYASDVLYRREERGKEDWQSIDRLYSAKSGDCEDLAAARVAELRLAGEPAMIAIGQQSSGVYHAVVRRADGTIEDPSRILIEREAKTMKAKPKITCKETGTGHYVASIELPTGGGNTMVASELGFDPFGALSKVVSKVFDVVSNPAVSALLPPQAAIAIQLVKKITDMSPAGLKKLINDDRAGDAEKDLATKVLDGKTNAIKEAAHGGAYTGDVVGAGWTDMLRAVSPAANLILRKDGGSSSGGRGPVRVLSKTTTGTRTPVNQPAGTPVATPGTVDPTTGLTWDGLRWTNPTGYNPGQFPGQQIPGYPQMPYPGLPGYPMPGYPQMPMPGYPMPGYPQMPMPGYPMPSYPQMPAAWPWPAESSQPAAQPMTPEEAAAVMIWGQGAFADGSFPGYDESGGAQSPWDPYGYGYGTPQGYPYYGY